MKRMQGIIIERSKYNLIRFLTKIKRENSNKKYAKSNEKIGIQNESYNQENDFFVTS